MTPKQKRRIEIRDETCRQMCNVLENARYGHFTTYHALTRVRGLLKKYDEDIANIDNSTTI